MVPIARVPSSHDATKFSTDNRPGESGAASAALFLHGLPLNGFHWRGVIARLSHQRRCLAPDFLGLGYTEASLDQDLSPTTQADMIAAVLDALSIEQADVVANDSGGAVAQLVAARYPTRVRTLLLTNCDVHTNSPPKSIDSAMAAARNGTLADVLARHLADKAFARSPEGLFSVCYANPSNLSDEAIDCYLSPLLSSPERRAQLHGYMVAFEPNPLPAIEPTLRRCEVPVRIVWGTADVHFDASWADWLDRAFPQSSGVRRVDGAMLFFPEEIPEVVAEEALALWAASPARGACSTERSRWRLTARRGGDRGAHRRATRCDRPWPPARSGTPSGPDRRARSPRSRPQCPRRARESRRCVHGIGA
jgi:haloalkane dehalogenase